MKKINHKSKKVVNTFLLLTLLSTLATSFIWGINTLFLLDAGLSNLEAFAANAFFTLGQVIFEIPTGIVADTWGRRTSYILGTLSLGFSTILYFFAWQIHAPFWMWAATSAFLGLGYTFFSGATEAWLVDALTFTKHKGELEDVFGKAQVVGGAAMLVGSVAGGIIAQATNLGVPYIFRTAFLGLTFVAASILMKDLGFTSLGTKKAIGHMKHIFASSVKNGLGNLPVRWMMISGAFRAGVSFYVFYAMQPFLLNLYGDKTAYSVAGLAAAITAGAQILGGVIAKYVRKFFVRRTSVLIFATILNTVLLLVIAGVGSFYLAVALLILWGITFSAAMPVRQAYLNKLIPSAERATVLSFDSLVGSSGGVFVQPVLGRVADISGYGVSYLVGSAFSILALPFILLARREKAEPDKITQ